MSTNTASKSSSSRRNTLASLAAALVVIVVAVGIAVSMRTDPEGTGQSVGGPQPVPSVTVKGESAARCPRADVVVRNAPDLQPALDAAQPGESIRLAQRVFRGEFVISESGTPEEPIWLCGAAASVLEGGPIDGGYTLHLDGADHWRISNLTIRGGQKGLMADEAVGNVIDAITVTRVGDEAIHLRDTSTDNVVQNSTVSLTGLREEEYGEGIYVGSAESNWCEISDCRPDRSDRNVIRYNTIGRTSAESVDIKEGTSDGLVLGNVFDGAGMTGADSWVDVKGNGWVIRGNRGMTAEEDGMQVHEILSAWGRSNVFADNVLIVQADGYGINVTKTRSGNKVLCTNAAEEAGSGMTNIDCTTS